MKRLLGFIVLMNVFSILNSQNEAGKYGMEVNELSELGGLQVGDIAPEISLVRPDGESFVLSEALKQGEVLVIFYRGYWCSICSRFLSGFEKDLAVLRERGVEVIAITPETYEYIDDTIEKTKTTIPVYSDTDDRVMKDYKVFFTVTDAYQSKLKNFINNDVAVVNGQENAALPVPASYLIGQDGKVRFRHYDINYRNRVSVDDVLRALDK